MNEAGLSRKHLIEGMTASLARLKVSYVDLVFCHRPDPLTPTETVVRGMSELVRQGKAFAWVSDCGRASRHWSNCPSVCLFCC